MLPKLAAAAFILAVTQSALADESRILARCPLQGDAVQAEARALNPLKRRMTVPQAADVDSKATLTAMLAPGDDRGRWSEQRAATITAYVMDVKVGGIESVNCHTHSPAYRDTHIELTAGGSSPELRYTNSSRAYPYRRKAAQPNIGGLLAQADAAKGRTGCGCIRHDPTTGVARQGNALGRELRLSCKAPACSGNSASSLAPQNKASGFKSAAALPPEPLIVEVTPQWRAQHPDWTTPELKHRLVGHWVKFTGWLMFDAEHAAESRNTCVRCLRIWRISGWEIHPVSDIQIIK